MTVSKYSLSQFLVLVWGLFVSLFFGFYYSGGDQEFYQQIYLVLEDLSLFEGFSYYSEHLNSFEIVHFMFSWIGSKLIEKNTWFALANCVLLFSFVRVANNKGYLPSIALLLVFSNFYLYVLMLSAERLKFGFIFAFIAFSSSGAARYVFYLLSTFGHAQMMILYASSLVSSIRYSSFKSRISPRELVLYFFLIVALVFLGLVGAEHVIAKALVYMQSGGLKNVIKPVIFLVFSMYCSPKYKEIISYFTLISVAAYFLGDTRITLFAYFGFLYFAVDRKRGVNAPVLLVSFYFLWKSVIYLQNTVFFNNGFA